MLLRKEHIDGDGLIGVRKIVGKPEDLLNLLPEKQQIEAKKYISKIRSERRIVEWLTTRVLLFELMGEDKIIGNRLDGRPFLMDDSRKISISHTKDYAAILLHKHYSVGIDVEAISDRVSKLAGKFISVDEYIDPSQKVIHQLLHWSAKETMFKIMEENEIDFKEHLRIQPFTLQRKGVIQAFESKTKQQKTFQIHYEVFPDVVLTWAINMGDGVCNSVKEN